MLFISITTIYFCGCHYFITVNGVNPNPSRHPIYYKEYSIVKNQPKLLTDTILVKDSFSLSYTDRAGKAQTVPGHKIFFQKNAKFLLYLLLMFTLSSISAGLCIPFLMKLIRTIKAIKNKGMVALILLFVLAMNAGFQFLSTVNPYVWYPNEMLDTLNIVLLHPSRDLSILVIPPYILDFIVESGLLIAAYHITEIKPVHHLQHEFFHIYRGSKRDINQYLTVLALIAGAGSVIATSALESAINESFTGSQNFNFMPRELSMIYAMLASFFIFIIYGPIHYLLLQKGRNVIALFNPLSVSDFDKWKATQLFLEEHIEVKSNFRANMFDAMLVLSPIIAAIVAAQLPK